MTGSLIPGYAKEANQVRACLKIIFGIISFLVSATNSTNEHKVLVCICDIRGKKYLFIQNL